MEITFQNLLYKRKHFQREKSSLVEEKQALKLAGEEDLLKNIQQVGFSSSFFIV